MYQIGSHLEQGVEEEEAERMAQVGGQPKAQDVALMMELLKGWVGVEAGVVLVEELVEAEV